MIEVGQTVKNSRAFTGAWIETKKIMPIIIKSMRRAFTGAWIETLSVALAAE